MQPTNTHGTLYLACSDNTEYLETTYAVIDVTPAWAQAMCGLVYHMAALRQASGPSRPLYQMEYWDWTPTWVTRPNLDDATEVLFEELDNTSSVYVPTDTHTWTICDDELQSVDGVTLCVQEDGIHWAAHVKHDYAARLESPEIPLRDLERYARGEHPEATFVWAYEPDQEGNNA